MNARVSSCVSFSRAWWGDGGHFRPAVIRQKEPIVVAAVMDLFVLAVQDLELPRERAFWFIWGPAAFITACYTGRVCERDGARGSERVCVSLWVCGFVILSSLLFVGAVSFSKQRKALERFFSFVPVTHNDTKHLPQDVTQKCKYWCGLFFIIRLLVGRPLSVLLLSSIIKIINY